MRNFLKRLTAEENGQGVVERTLLIGLVALIYAAVAPAAGFQAALTGVDITAGG